MLKQLQIALILPMGTVAERGCRGQRNKNLHLHCLHSNWHTHTLPTNLARPPGTYEQSGMTKQLLEWKKWAPLY